jgi:hypothetical protein
VLEKVTSCSSYSLLHAYVAINLDAAYVANGERRISTCRPPANLLTPIEILDDKDENHAVLDLPQSGPYSMLSIAGYVATSFVYRRWCRFLYTQHYFSRNTRVAQVAGRLSLMCFSCGWRPFRAF